jgi:hypothetical protein
MADTDGIRTLEEYIERDLLKETEVVDTYESIYDMGNPYELSDEECEYTALAKEIINVMSLVGEDDVDAKLIDFVKIFDRPGGLKEQLKESLDFDLELFDKNNNKYKREICKILYFFYMLKNKYFPRINVLELLSKHSMENIDNSFLGMKTVYGRIIKIIKDSLEKELSLLPSSNKNKNNIKNAVRHVALTWDIFLDCVRMGMDYLAERGCKYEFEKIIGRFFFEPAPEKP